MNLIRLPLAVVVLCFAPLALSAADPKEPKDPFAAVDAHALNASGLAEETLESLGKYLAKAGKTDREKARAVYRWVTDRIAYDVESLLAEKRPDGSAENVLKTRLCVCDGYSNIFKALCLEAGLKCERLTGRAKGPGFDADPKAKKFNHAWNAVEIDGKWLLIDSTWGAGSIKDKTFEKKFTDFFFLIDSEKLIFTHLPKDEKWQMVKNPLSEADFIAQPQVPSPLFRLGIAPEKLTKAIAEKNFKQFPKGFDHPGVGTTKMLAGPLNGVLKAGTPYEFQFTADVYDTMIFVIDGKPTFFAKDGKVFKAKLSFPKGKVQIHGRGPKEKSFHGILEYIIE